MMLVSLAGPGSNILLAIVGLLIWKLAGFMPALQSPGLQAFVEANLIINVVLAAFNLIPVPPLDGSKIIMGLLPENLAYKYARLEPMGMIIVIILLVTGLLNVIFRPIFEFIMLLMKFFM